MAKKDLEEIGDYAFYRLQRGEILIERVLYGRRNYIALLFGDIFQEK